MVLILSTIFFHLLRYWDIRQPQPVHVQQLPERCYALSLSYPLMVVGTADRNIIVFNLQNPQVMLLSSPLCPFRCFGFYSGYAIIVRV
jgi:mRNA export factor